MTSPLLALFVRSLREDNRVKLTYFARAGLIAFILLFLFTIQTSIGWGGAPGLRFFDSVININLCFTLLAGVSYFASVIAEEKEEMTLGLLRMTNLNPLSILLGKSTSRLCGALLLLAAQLPFTLLAITLGGVSLGQVVAAYCALAAFIVFMSNLALLASVICRRTGGAALFTGLVFFTVIIAVPVANWLAMLPVRLGLIVSSSAWVGTLNSIAALADKVSPFTRVNEILRTGFHESPLCFQVVSNLALGAGCFLLAWAVFEIFCGEQKESAPSRAGIARRHSLFRAFSPGRTWHRALAWKDFYFLTGGKLVMLLKFVVYGIPLVIIHFWPVALGGPPRWKIFGFSIVWMMLVFMGIELAFVMSRVFRIERQWQTLSSLAMLPQGIRRVAYQKLLGVFPALIPAFCYFLLGVWIVVEALSKEWHAAGAETHNEWMEAMVYAASQIIFFLHLVANLSLRVKRGGLPLAMGTYFILSMATGLGMSAMRYGNSSMIPFIVLTVVATVFLHVNIGQRLEALAAEG